MRDPGRVGIRFPLRTEHLLIRPFEPADRTAMQAIYADPQVMRFITGAGEDPSTWVDSYIRHQADHGYAFWALIDPADGELIGEAGLGPLDGRGPQLELGYLLRRDRWGLGLATEAARACVAAAFDGLGVATVVAVVDEGNDASVAVLRKAGFQLTGMRTAHGVRQHVLRALAGPNRPA
jgi:ribosomal-protein-alanine N-acetyltransferase